MSAKTDYCSAHRLDIPRWSPYRCGIKRLLDLAATLPILLVVSPVLIISAILVKLDSRGPVFFVQKRLGRYGETFLTYKFRSMTDRKRTPNAEVLPGHSEVTRVGHWLRRFKIDELPQLLNIVNGDMSLVGPRPALPDHINEYNSDGLKRLIERPGLTGMSQVNGNIYLSWPERWHYDARYVRNLSFLNDAAILAKTVAVVLLGEEKFLNKPELAIEDSASEVTAPESEQRHAA